MEGGARGGQRDAGGGSEERRLWRGRRQGGRRNDKALGEGGLVVVLVVVVVMEERPWRSGDGQGRAAGCCFSAAAPRRFEGALGREGLAESLTQLGQRDRQLGSTRFA